MLRLFFVAWLIGVVGIVMSGQVEQGWLALSGVAGLILVWIGLRLWRDRRAWLAFVEKRRSRPRVIELAECEDATSA